MRHCGGGFCGGPWVLFAAAFGLGVLLTFICSFQLVILVSAILLIGCGIVTSRRYF